MRPVSLLLLALCALAALGGACRSESTLPGDQTLGVLDLQATLLPGSGCNPLDLPAAGPDGDAGFGFNAAFNRESATGRVFVTVDGFTRDAGLEEQTVVSVHRGTVQLEHCRDCTGTQLEETLRVVLLSEAQRAQVQGSCALALDGGLADAGAPPQPVEVDGVGAVAACGRLTAVVVPGQGCACATCTMDFFLESR